MNIEISLKMMMKKLFQNKRLLYYYVFGNLVVGAKKAIIRRTKDSRISMQERWLVKLIVATNLMTRAIETKKAFIDGQTDGRIKWLKMVLHEGMLAGKNDCGDKSNLGTRVSHNHHHIRNAASV